MLKKAITFIPNTACSPNAMVELLPNLKFLIYLFNAIAAFNSIAIIYLFIRHHNSYSPATRSLGLYLFSMLVVNLMIFLIHSGYIVYIPWLYRLPSPLFYTMFPAAYLYVKMTLADQEKLKRVEYLHFLPAALHLIEMIPYHLHNNEYKLRHILESARNPLGAYLHDEGLFPPYIHNILRAVQGIIYGTIMIWMVGKAFQLKKKLIRNYPGMINWLLVFSTLVLAFSLSIIVAFIGQWASAEIRSLNLAFWAAVSLGVTSVAMITNPLLLYGMPRLNRVLNRRPEEGSLEENVQLEKPTAEETVGSEGIQNPASQPKWVEKYTEQIDVYRKSSRSFLSPKYSIRDMSMELGIPQHHLSYLLNNIYHTRFNDFVNQLRIEHLGRRVAESDQLKEKTLEGLAREAGFSSRVTFIRAVQRITGQNPKDYFHQLLTPPAEARSSD